MKRSKAYIELENKVLPPSVFEAIQEDRRRVAKKTKAAKKAALVKSAPYGVTVKPSAIESAWQKAKREAGCSMKTGAACLAELEKKAA